MTSPVTERQLEALAVLAAVDRWLTPSQFAARLWRDKEWARSGGAHEEGPDASGRHGAKVLLGLVRMKLATTRRRPGYWEARITPAGLAVLTAHRPHRTGEVHDTGIDHQP